MPTGTPRSSRRGFTAIELMVTVAIVAIFATLAAPSFRQLIATQRVKSVASALTESLWVARSEALKRNEDVQFVFANAGANTLVADWKITRSSDTVTPLIQQSGSPSVVSTTSSGGNLLFVFNAFGRSTNPGAASWIKLSVPSTGADRWVCISATGRATTQSTSCP